MLGIGGAGGGCGCARACSPPLASSWRPWGSHCSSAASFRCRSGPCPAEKSAGTLRPNQPRPAQVTRAARPSPGRRAGPLPCSPARRLLFTRATAPPPPAALAAVMAVAAGPALPSPLFFGRVRRGGGRGGGDRCLAAHRSVCRRRFVSGLLGCEIVEVGAAGASLVL